MLRDQRVNWDQWDQEEKTASKARLVLLETEVQLDPWACRDQRASQETLVRSERLEVLEFLVKGDQMEKMERKELLVQLVLLVQQEREESRDLRESTASRVCLDNQVLLESLENQEMRVLLERSVQEELQVQEEKEVLQEKEVKSDPTGCRDLKVVQVDQDQTGQRGTLVQREQEENQEVQD